MLYAPQLMRNGSRLTPRQLRTAVSFAEAIIPGSSGVTGADAVTAYKTEQMLEHVSPWLRTAWLSSMQAMDLAAVPLTGRRFHRLSVGEQEALMRRWENNPAMRGVLLAVAFAFKFTHFDRTPVYRSLGGRLNVVDSMEEPRWLERVHRADEWEDGEVEAEVVVVGTGAGGAVVGRELAEKGLAVAFVEEGEHYRRDDFTGSSVDAHIRFYRGVPSVGNAVMPIFMGRLVGGSTAINTGTCFRTPEHVLNEWALELGSSDFLPENMDRYFARVEEHLPVEPPDPRYVGAIADIVARGCADAGWKHGYVMRNAPGCKGEGFCDFGCRTDARRSTNLSYLPPALERGGLLLTGLRARSLVIEDGRAVGVRGVTKSGKTLSVRAPTVIFAGGAVPTPAFLLRQRLCNDSGQVGRNLSVHPSAGMTAVFDEHVDGAHSIPQGYQVDEWLKEGLLLLSAQADYNYLALMLPTTGERLMHTMEHADNVASLGVLIRDSSRGRVRLGPNREPVVTYNLNGHDVRQLHRGLVKAGQIFRAAGAKQLIPSVMSAGVIETDRAWEQFQLASISATQLMLTSYHPLGTCRMGSDPKTSVVDLDHAAHDLPGLYIVDGSTVPGPPSVNPQVTIMAMATRAAERIADRLS